MRTLPSYKTAPSNATLLFQHPSRRVRRAELRAFWRELAVTMGSSAATCLVTTDAELRRLNREFRRQDSATDVLSFPGGEGEVAISLDRAEEQAAEMGHSVDDELRILMLHGLLHLKGMDHETDSGEMKRAEVRWRKKFQLPIGLIERAHA
jgi:probable rRNA maturation factor